MTSPSVPTSFYHSSLSSLIPSMFPFKSDPARKSASQGESSTIPLAPQSLSFQPFRSSSHPSLRFTLNTTLPSISDFLSIRQGCHVHLDLSFPDALFIDREELRDTLGDVSWTLEPDFIDIERPVLPNGPDGERSEELAHLYLEIKHIDDKYTEETVVKVPLHARYLEPREGGHETVWLFAGGSSGEVRGGWVCGTDRHKSESQLGRKKKRAVAHGRFTCCSDITAHCNATNRSTVSSALGGIWNGFGSLAMFRLASVQNHQDSSSAG